MSRIFEATCEANVVKIGGKPVDNTVVLSEGVAASTGVGLMQGDEMHYIAKTSGDLKTVIGKVSDLIQLLSDTLTAIGTGMTGPTTAPPGSLPTSITQLATMKTALNTLKDNLR